MNNLGIDPDQAGVYRIEQLVSYRMKGVPLANSSRCATSGLVGIAITFIAMLTATDTSAQVLTPFRYEDQAQRHCPADTVVWLDFEKRRYYLTGQKLYGTGFHGSFVCLHEARRSHYRRSLLGRR